MIGDMHFEVPQVVYQQGHMAVALDDLNRMTGRDTVAVWGQVGDTTSRGDTLGYFTDWWARLDRAGAPSALVPGNHDLVGPQPAYGMPDTNTPVQWAARVGAPAPCYVIDAGGVRIVCLSPTADVTASSVNRLILGPCELAFLASSAASTSAPVVVLFHGPLANTVAWSGPVDMHAGDTPTARIVDTLAAHPNIVAWVSGHTHAPASTVGTVVAATYGTTTLAAVSASALVPYAPGQVTHATSARVTILPGRVEVRYRDHHARQWLDPVHTVLTGGDT